LDLYNMGFSEAVRGDDERAEALFEESLAMSRELKDTYGAAISLMSLGDVATRRGDHGRARALLKESLVVFNELGARVNIAECLEILSGMAGALGDDARATRLWGAADALREAIGSPWPPAERRLHEPYLTATRSHADEAVWARAWEEGRAMTMEEAVAYALEDMEERG
jgi:tetratricopeptide (TPR) repeat protein